MARNSLGVAREGLIRVWQSLWKLHWLEQVTDGMLSTRWYLREGGREGRVQVCWRGIALHQRTQVAGVRSANDPEYRCSLNTQLHNVLLLCKAHSECVCLSVCL